MFGNSSVLDKSAFNGTMKAHANRLTFLQNQKTKLLADLEDHEKHVKEQIAVLDEEIAQKTEVHAALKTLVEKL